MVGCGMVRYATHGAASYTVLLGCNTMNGKRVLSELKALHSIARCTASMQPAVHVVLHVAAGAARQQACCCPLQQVPCAAHCCSLPPATLPPTMDRPMPL